MTDEDDKGPKPTAALAQPAEHRAFNPGVVSSSLTRRTNCTRCGKPYRLSANVESHEYFSHGIPLPGLTVQRILRDGLESEALRT